MLKSALFALIKKEFISVWKDKKSRFVIFFPPVLQLFIFSHAATLDIVNIKMGILDRTNSEISRELTRQIKSSRYFSQVYNFKNEKQLKNALDEEKIRAAVYLNNDFSNEFKKNKNPKMLIITDGRRTNASQIIANYISEIAQTFVTMGKPASLDLVKFETRNRYNPNLSYHWFIISSLMGILPMTTVVLLAALSVAREKENGTFDELLVVPLTIEQIVTGKAAIPLFFGMLNGVIMLLLSIIFFKLPFYGSFILYVISLFFFLLCITGVGLFVSSISKTQQQAMLFVFVFMFPSIILSGYTTPIENITPAVLQHLTLLNPLRFFLVISKGIILKNMNFYYIFLNTIPITLISLLTLKSAEIAFKRKLE